MHMILLTAIDPSIGKVDQSTLSQQTTMELLVENIMNVTKVTGDFEAPNTIDKWKGITLDASGNVKCINWEHQYNLNGPLPLQWLPHTLRGIDVTANWLCGSLDLDVLPALLIEVFLGQNNFEGTVSLRHLPPGLLVLELVGNRLSGPIDLTSLPSGLQGLLLGNNPFEGETDFSKLPDSLMHLTIGNTKLSGVVPFRKGQRVVCYLSQVKVLVE